ncbi:MAG: hypothetical protein ACK5NL_04505 [Vibrio fluvialis]
MLKPAAYQRLPQFKQAIAHVLTDKKRFDIYCSEILLQIIPTMENAAPHETYPDKCFYLSD